MIADWDLRAASELTSYFSRHQYKPIIEKPIYEYKEASVTDYIDNVLKVFDIGRKTAIIIGSPDVNPLTEIVLGRLYGVPKDELFAVPKVLPAGDAIVAVKRRKLGQEAKVNATPRVFCLDEEGKDENEWRGFFCRLIRDNAGYAVQKYYGPKEAREEPFPVYAHLVVAKNPFPSDEEGRDTQPRFLVVLNGAAGPATVALTHVLTGEGKEQELKEGFDPVTSSETILKLLLDQMQQDPDFFALHCFLKVTIKSDEGGGGAATFDRRREFAWELTDEVIKPKVRKFADVKVSGW
jgi:hypothetical protein